MKTNSIIYFAILFSARLNAQTECLEYELEVNNITTYHNGHCGHKDSKPSVFHWKASFSTIKECSEYLNREADKVYNGECAHVEIEIIKACTCSLYNRQTKTDTMKTSRRLDGMCVNQKQNAQLLNSKFENWKSSPSKDNRVGNFYKNALKGVRSLDCDVVLKDVNCVNGNCTIEWDIKNENQEAARKSIEGYYDNLKLKQDEQLANEVLVNLGIELVNAFITEIENGKNSTANKNISTTEEKSSVLDNDGDGKNETIIETKADGTQIMYIDTDDNGFADTKVTIGKDGIPVYEPVVAQILTNATADKSNSKEAVTEGSSWKQDVKGIWDGVKDFFGAASTTADIAGNDATQKGFGSVSDMMGYLETSGKIQKAIQNPNDYENIGSVAQDVFDYAGKAGGTLGVSQFSLPVDLYKQTFEATTDRLKSFISTGDPGDEMQVYAPIMNLLGSTMYLGNIGTLERSRRLEGYKSFSELKNQYGYIGATKQKFYNWFVGDL